MFIDNKYKKWYYKIIKNAQDRDIVPGYSERHHIIPKSFFALSINELHGHNPNNKTNLVDLTFREHFICHLLLVKMTSGELRKKMALAAYMFVHSKKHTVKNSREYSCLRQEFIDANSGLCNGFYGKKHTEKTRHKMSIAAKARPGNRTGAVLSEETKLRIKQSRTNGLKSGAIVAWNTGLKENLKISCPHCGKTMPTKSVFTRYHGDNCKNKKAA